MCVMAAVLKIRLEKMDRYEKEEELCCEVWSLALFAFKCVMAAEETALCVFVCVS